jgi:large subunit ribosomal protein L28
MAKRCAICGKEPQYGHHVSHAKNRVNRRFEPNLQMGRVTVSGRSFRARVCTLPAHVRRLSGWAA